MAVEIITLEQMLQSYRWLTAELRAGRMTQGQYTAALAGLQGVDAAGHWWGVQPGGQFWMHDGTHWVAATPPGLAAPAARRQPARSRSVQPKAQAVQKPAPAKATAQPGQAGSGLRGLLAATPVLALVPSVVVGGVWFLYTFVGLFKGEGAAGVDWLTPVIVAGFPILFWIFKKPIDRMLMPLKPTIVALAKPLRLGIVMAVPVLLSCICTTATPSGYLGLNVSSFVSVIAAAILMRY